MTKSCAAIHSLLSFGLLGGRAWIWLVMALSVGLL